MKNTLKTIALALLSALCLAACGGKEELFTIIVNSNNAQWGTTYGSGEYAAGTKVQIAATPVVGYKFVNWTDGSVENPRTITVNASAAYTAIFADLNDNGGGGTGGGNQGGEDIPADSNTHAVVTFGDTTWEAVLMVKQNVGSIIQMTLMSDQEGATPSVTFHFPGQTGTFNYTPGQVSVYYMNNFDDFATVNGQEYPHYLCVNQCTINVTDYNLNAGKMSGTINASLLDMEREGQGLPAVFKTLSVEFEDFYFSEYNN